jgi:SagB-type dehydrogenase family enzyme
MRQIVTIYFYAALIFISGLLASQSAASGGEKRIILPQPAVSSNVSVEEALLARKSTRSFSKDPLLLSEISQLLWAAQGVTRKDGKRTAPSAGALYPLEVYVVASKVHGLGPGIYHYLPEDHELELVHSGDLKIQLFTAALRQESIQVANTIIVLAAVYSRTAQKYRSRASRYVHMETGHAAQNISLQAVSLGLGCATIGAFDDSSVKRVLKMKTNEAPLYIIPLGRAW